MEVFKRPGSPMWYVDLAHPATGARLRKSLKFKGSKLEAQKRANKLQLELEKEAEGYADGRRPITTREALERYVAALTARGQTSAKNNAYRRDKLLTLLPDGGRAHLHELSPATLESIVLERTKGGKKPQTIKHDIALIRAAARYAESLGFRGPERMGDWRVPKVTQKTRYLSPEEYDLVYTYLDPERPLTMHARGGKDVTYTLGPEARAARAEGRDLLVALAYTGGRWNEVAQLTWDQIDLSAGVIRLWAGKVQRERLIPVAEPLRAVLRRRLAERGANQRLVFPGPGGRPRAKPTASIGDAMTAVGLNDPGTVARFGKATIHSLRHTFASWLRQNGADLDEVAGALGHASLAMSSRYAHLGKQQTLTKIGGILNGIARNTEPEDTPTGG